MIRIHAVVALLAFVLAGSTAWVWAGPSDGIVGLPAWDRYPTPNLGESRSEFRGVQVFTFSDVWAVGHVVDRTLAEHWNGSSFEVVASPSVPNRANLLEDVDGVASNDVWAIGHADVIGFLGSKSLALHWDGSTWTRVPTPNLGHSVDYNNLTGIAAVAPDDVWAVGTFQDNSGGFSFRALIEHWNGTAWSGVPNLCGFGLSDVDARTATDIWAVGGSDACHWDGSTWTRFPVGPPPNPEYFVDLIDVTVISPSDAWAVGQEISECGEQVCFSGDIHHWNGTTWSYVTNFLDIGYGVDAVAADDIWAVGPGPAILHYDGTEWSRVPDGVEAGELWAVEASDPDNIWASGDRFGSRTSSLVEHAPSAYSGAVVGTSNVGGATVSWFGPETGSVETDPFGDYQVGGLNAGTYVFTVSYPGCQPDSARVNVVAGQTIGQAFHLTC